MTSEFHLPRTKAIFETCFKLAGRSIWHDEERFDLHYYAASDEGLFPHDVLQARIMREAASLQDWLNQSQDLDSFAALHSWLYSTHLCYSASRQDEFGKGIDNSMDDKALATY